MTSSPRVDQRFVTKVKPGETTDAEGPSPAERAERLAGGTADVERYLRQQLKDLEIPGMATAVLFGDKPIITLGLGVRDLDSRAPVADDTVFRIGSVTKTLTGLALLQLRDTGLLSLDDPVARYVPEIAGVLYPTSDSPRITLRHLVTHTSGLPRLGTLDYTSGDQPVSEEQLLAALKDLPLLAAPATQTEYSNLAMGIGGLVVCRVADEKLRLYVTNRLLRPLGMTSSWWDQAQVPKGRLATGYRRKDGEHVKEPHWKLGAAEGLGGLYSSLADMTRFAAFQLSAWPARDDPDDGPVRRATVRESQLIAGYGRPTGQAFGINWASINQPGLGWAVAHTGGTFQYGATIWLLPDRQLGVVMLINTGGEAGEVALRLSELAVEVLSILRRHDPAFKVKLTKPLKTALETVHSLLEDPKDAQIDEWFSDKFLAEVPKDRLTKVLQKSGESLGKCTAHEAMQTLGKHAAVVRLICEKGSADLTIYLADNPPHQITGFAIGGIKEEGEEEEEEGEEAEEEPAAEPEAKPKAPKPKAPKPKAPKPKAPMPKPPEDAYD